MFYLGKKAVFGVHWQIGWSVGSVIILGGSGDISLET